MIPTAPKPFTHMTVIGWRTPKQKAHTTLGHAKNAINAKIGTYTGAQCDMELYELKDGEWSLLWEIPRGTLDRDLPWKMGGK